MDTGIDELEMRLNLQRVEGLYHMHEYMISIYNATDNLEILLHGHMTQMYWRLEDMLNQKNVKKGKKKHFTMRITAVEAMAFCLLWGNEKFDMTLPGAVEIVKTLGEIDKATNIPRRIYG